MENIVLIGFMGCGKSTISRCVGQRTGWMMMDTDQLVVEKAGRSIPEIFATDGEAHFRQLETEVLRELQGVKNAVIATGGGIVETAENWPLLRQLGPVFFLDAPWSELQQRIAAGKGRPLGGDGKDWGPVHGLWQRRLPLYRQLGQVINCANMGIHDVVGEILLRCKEG